ncbi:hypothetical protein O6H91_15G056100 [Diphasiastrum complanatum]|uniref:Uncharacterized protein n=1 Tax=Diphasiastrum complanatum TaxID=34168 RepID=A0ACC2BIF5_DIPCM|nr:hypothetical protein O6H91_Y084300 [Diphasiastrum complanatum]KAJ7297032.1 hypothetical protein O6H91_Y084300 [Diphasiastrum complanatum]KAJ7297033.1 hypothetical protein O6H91_Y084300 [Diphasiastrum complanatum]KAJ7529540.1 hypothetical protein O6H91_15G056100 [Diphasiastrum complanatum]
MAMALCQVIFPREAMALAKRLPTDGLCSVSGLPSKIQYSKVALRESFSSYSFRRAKTVPVLRGEAISQCVTPPESIELPKDLTWPNRTRFSGDAKAKLIAVVGAETLSPLGDATWEEVMRHMASRISWVDNGFELIVFTDKSLTSGLLASEFRAALQEATILVVVSVQEGEPARYLLNCTAEISTSVSFDSDPAFETRLGGVKVFPEGPIESFFKVLPGSNISRNVKIFETVAQAWERHSSDNYCFAILVLIDSYASSVKLLKNLRATNLASIQCMVKNCRSKILACILDPTCRKALQCLTSCAPSDQVCSYRCIASYESPLFEAFSLCVLQKHNCLGLTAEIQMEPNVIPMSRFKGEPLTHLTAEDLFVGWLGKLDWSWRVVGGQNAAYDQFPCQYQLFYRGKAKGSMWYDPVFQVQTLDGQLVWRRRHYRVKRGEIPGTFYFSVLDNGVVSKEFWRIVDVTDDLSWGLFYYSGAAEVVGQSYTGAVLVSPDGLWPAESEQKRLNIALQNCGIKTWEMYSVDNCSCDNAPLGIPEGSRLQLSVLSS